MSKTSSEGGDLAAHYAVLLGLEEPWQVREVDLQPKERRVVICLGLRAGAQLCCPQCGQPAPGYDLGAERTWRHLDTMRFETVGLC